MTSGAAKVWHMGENVNLSLQVQNSWGVPTTDRGSSNKGLWGLLRGMQGPCQEIEGLVRLRLAEIWLPILRLITF